MSVRTVRTATTTVLVALVLLAVAACTPPPRPPADGVGAGRACTTNNRGPTGEGLTKTITVNGGPAGPSSTVDPGDLVEFTLAWDPAAFGGAPLQAVDCVYMDRVDGHTLGRGTRVRELEAIEQPLPAGVVSSGRWAKSYEVPARAAGKLLCDRGRVVGPPAADGPAEIGTAESRAAEAAPERMILRSNEICLRVSGGPDPVIPEFPIPFLSVLATLVAVGLVTVHLRRRAA